MPCQLRGQKARFTPNIYYRSSERQRESSKEHYQSLNANMAEQEYLQSVLEVQEQKLLHFKQKLSLQKSELSKQKQEIIFRKEKLRKKLKICPEVLHRIQESEEKVEEKK